MEGKENQENISCDEEVVVVSSYYPEGLTFSSVCAVRLKSSVRQRPVTLFFSMRLLTLMCLGLTRIHGSEIYEVL